MDPYEKHIVKEYTHWKVYVHKNQQFLGRCIIWAKRDSAEDLSLASREEQEELFVVLNEIRRAIIKAFGATWFNYSFLGNVDRHLHGHLIPRYRTPVTFNEVQFIDPDYNKNPYKIELPNETSEGVIVAVRDTLSKVI